MSVLARLWAALLLAVSMGPAWAQPVLQLVPGQVALDLAPYLALRVDPQARARLEDILATPGFEPPSPVALRPGYSASAYWLRLRLHNPSAQTLQRLLQVPPARLEEISLFVADDQGHWQRWDAGTATRFAQRAQPWRLSTFALTLAPGQTQELLLRVASRSAITLRPWLWEPQALAARQQQVLLGDGLMLGMMGLLLLVALLLAVVLRERAYAYTALYLLCCMAYESGMRGISFMLLWPDATDWAVRSLSSFGVLAMLMEWLALNRMLGLRRSQPGLQRLLLGVALLQCIGLGWCLWGDYRLGSVLLSQVNTLAYLGMLAAAWRAWRARHPLAKPWLGMLLASMLGMLPRYAELLGLLPNTPLSEYAPPLAGLLGSVLVLAGLLRRLQRQRARQELRLELAVRERTLALDEARTRAERSDMAKGRLLGYLGHDLRAPLASMVQVARQMSPDAEFEAGRRAIEHSSLLALEMIDEMQHFARDPQSEARLEILPAPLYLHGLLEEIVAQSQALARAGGNSLVLRISADMPAVVQLDARRLRQVLVNLLANAAKFTRGGRIALEAGVAETGALALAVRDNGPGIAAADLTRVFQPYERGSSVGYRPGIGLGLSIAHQLVQAMGGEISVASRPGQGACFSLSLPRVDADEEDVQWPPARPWLSQPLGEGQQALLLDACENARAALRERLVLAGFDCLEAADQSEAEHLLSAQPIRLVVAEPAQNPAWVDWLGSWQRRRPALAVLLCSRLHRPVRQGLPCLLKPAAESEWWPALAGLLRGDAAPP